MRDATGFCTTRGLHSSFLFPAVRIGEGAAADWLRRRFGGWKLPLFDAILQKDFWGGTFRPTVLILTPCSSMDRFRFSIFLLVMIAAWIVGCRVVSCLFDFGGNACFCLCCTFLVCSKEPKVNLVRPHHDFSRRFNLNKLVLIMPPDCQYHSFLMRMNLRSEM